MISNTIKSVICIFTLLVSFFANGAPVINQSSGSFSVLNSAYSNNLELVWNINTGESQKVTINYTVDTQIYYDMLYIYDVDASGTITLLQEVSGADYGSITTTSLSGKAKVVFQTDASICNNAGYTGITFSFMSEGSVELINNNLKVQANSYVMGDALIMGKTGIGIASPEERLHINGSVRGNAGGGALRINTETGYLDLGSMNDSWAHIYTNKPGIITNVPIWSISGAFSAYQNSDLSLQTNGTTRMTILATNGNVGIGTTTPNHKLEVHGVSKLSGDIWAADKLAFLDNAQFTVTNTVAPNLNVPTFSMPHYGIATPSTGGSADLWLSGINGIKLFTNSTPRFVIDNIGKIGIGTITPNADLQIGNSISNTGTPKMRIVAPATGTSDIDALHIDYDGANFEKGVAISLGTMSSTYGEYTSRIIHYGFSSQTRASKLQLQTHSATQGVWNAGILIDQEGKVGIGTNKPSDLLSVNGIIRAKEVKIDLCEDLADYVFSPDYSLMPLHKVEAFVKTNKHLPEIPSAAEVKEKGLSMGEMQNKLLQKIEELTLYVIEQQKRIEQLEKNQK